MLSLHRLKYQGQSAEPTNQPQQPQYKNKPKSQTH